MTIVRSHTKAETLTPLFDSVVYYAHVLMFPFLNDALSQLHWSPFWVFLLSIRISAPFLRQLAYEIHS